MKKNLITYLLTLYTLGLFAQKTIENPEHGLSTIPGSITKIELLENETIVHFHLKTTPNSKFSIPPKTYIQDLDNTKKLFVTKANGIKIKKWETVPESGEIDYSLYFPKVNNEVTTLEFGENNDGGDWYVYDIVIKPNKNDILPKKLKGNWFRTDGSKLFDYSFNTTNAIINKEIWNYTSVKGSKNKFTLVLAKDGDSKKIKAKLNNDGVLTLKEDRHQKVAYSQNIVTNPNYNFKNNTPFTTLDFKADTTTYAGIIKNFTPRIGVKTGMIYINNVFTGDQESYLIKIKDDGSFSVKFPVTHPQFILTRAFKNNKSVFIAPGKETFHVIDGQTDFFMGDNAQINTDLESMSAINMRSIDNKLRKTVLNIKPEDYKTDYLNAYQAELKKLEVLKNKEFISQKALQIKELSLEYSMLEGILSYDMNKSSALRNLKPEEKKDLKEYPLNKDYVSVITPVVLNNQMAVMSLEYSSFINRLKYSSVLRGTSYTSTLTQNEINKALEKQNIVISEDVKKAFKEQELLKNPEKEKRQTDFNKTYGKSFSSFYKANTIAIKEIQTKNPEGDIFNILKVALKKEGKLSPLDEEMLIAFNQIETPEQKIKSKEFSKKYTSVLQEFYKENNTQINKIYQEDYQASAHKKRNEVLGIDSCFVFDVFTLQEKTGELIKDLTPYTKEELEKAKQEISNPLLANYLDIENNRTIAILEANKTKTGYTINNVEKTEGDELFESMITKFKGKVIYVDFWATWCPPCISGIKRIAPLKEEMLDKKVVFLYISAPSSPEKTWKNSIPNIKGEHYRVTQDEWNYLTNKFKVTGIPHYALVNKKGEIINPKLGHHSNDKIKKILEEELKK